MLRNKIAAYRITETKQLQVVDVLKKVIECDWKKSMHTSSDRPIPIILDYDIT